MSKLRRLSNLTAPGGTLVAIGCARSSTLPDHLLDAVGVVQHQIYSRTRGFWQHNAPVQMQFPHTYTEVKQTATAVLPGMAWRRLPLWRYAITWHKNEVAPPFTDSMVRLDGMSTQFIRERRGDSAAAADQLPNGQRNDPWGHQI